MNRSPVSPMSPSGHIAPDALLRRLDAAATPEELTAIEHHLKTCDRCRTVAERIERQSGDLGLLLDKAYPPVYTAWQPPARRADRSSWWWAVAAILATVIAVGAFAPPVRAWVGERLQGILGNGEEPALVDATGTAGPVEETPDGPGNVVVFQPTGPEFTVDVSEMIVGRWIISISAGGAATAEVLRGVPPEIIVLPDGLRMMADSALDADLRINLPPTVRRIIVRVDGRPVATYDNSAESSETSKSWELRLGGQ